MNKSFSSFAILLLVALLLAPVAKGGEPGGRVVWWGHNIFWKNSFSYHTNGVIETDDGLLSDAGFLAAGHWQAYAHRQDGTVLSLGRDYYEGSNLPPGLSNVVSLTMQGSSTWAVRSDGSVVQWGLDPDRANTVSTLKDIRSVAWAGYRSFIALKRDGTLMGVRLDQAGMLNGVRLDRPDPALPVRAGGQLVSNVTQIAANAGTPILLLTDGSVVELIPDRSPVHSSSRMPPFEYGRLAPIRINNENLWDVASIAGSGSHGLAVRSNGTVVAWGHNSSGQCEVPADLSNVVAVAAAGQRSLALKRDGTVVAWGGNFHGEASVPPGLTNVVAIAAGSFFSMAVTTGAIPPSVYVRPRGRLEELEREADFIFKGQVIASTPATNASFPHWGNPHATQFRVISVFKGNAPTNAPILWHNTSGPMVWSGGGPPSWHQFESGQSYLVFAVNLDKSDHLYAPPPDATNRPGEFRQTYRPGVTRALDARPVELPMKEAHWVELNRLLTDTNPTNSLNAIKQLDSMSKDCGPHNYWPRSEDFKRSEVLRVLRPLLSDTNEAVAVAAIGCYRVSFPCASQLSPHIEALIQIASQGPSIPRRVAAIAALTGSRMAAIRPQLPAWLNDAHEEVRAQAVSLLADFPGGFAEAELRRSAGDHSPRVRAVTADVIGEGLMTNLLDTLAGLFQDPVGREQPLPPLTIENLEAGGRAGVCCDVHTSAGFALLKFDVQLVADILKTNLHDVGFRPNFLCKLAEHDAGPWLQELVAVLTTRRERITKQVEASNVEPRANYHRALMALSGTYFRSWNIIYEHLKGLPFAAFANGKLDDCLAELEQAGTTGSREPVMLYELYRMKGLNRRAAQYRKTHEPGLTPYNISQFFDKIDARYPQNGAIPDQ